MARNDYDGLDSLADPTNITRAAAELRRLNEPAPAERFEYRVCWRREHDKRQRTRLYQTLKGAEDFASFLEAPPWDPQDGSILGDNLAALGDPTEVRIERRVVGEWERNGGDS